MIVVRGEVQMVLESTSLRRTAVLSSQDLRGRMYHVLS